MGFPPQGYGSVSITGTETLTNKTLTDPKLAGSSLELFTGLTGEPRIFGSGNDIHLQPRTAGALVRIITSGGGSEIDIRNTTVGGAMYPAGNKQGSVGLTGSRWLDGFFGNALTTGTSRTYEVSKLLCPRCNIKAKRSTGGLCINGYDEDYYLCFCPNCQIAMIDIVKHQGKIFIPPFDEAQFVDIKTGSHGGTSNYIFLRFKYRYKNKEYVNGTFLSETERKLMESSNEMEKKNFIEYLMQVEWEATYRTEIMEERVKVVEKQYKKNHLHNLIGIKMKRR